MTARGLVDRSGLTHGINWIRRSLLVPLTTAQGFSPAMTKIGGRVSQLGWRAYYGMHTTLDGEQVELGGWLDPPSERRAPLERGEGLSCIGESGNRGISLASGFSFPFLCSGCFPRLLLLGEARGLDQTRMISLFASRTYRSVGCTPCRSVPDVMSRST